MPAIVRFLDYNRRESTRIRARWLGEYLANTAPVRDLAESEIASVEAMAVDIVEPRGKTAGVQNGVFSINFLCIDGNSAYPYRPVGM
jgi:hypothetical protein